MGLKCAWPGARGVAWRAKAFEQFDVNSDGALTLDELRDALSARLHAARPYMQRDREANSPRDELGTPVGACAGGAP